MPKLIDYPTASKPSATRCTRSPSRRVSPGSVSTPLPIWTNQPYPVQILAILRTRTRQDFSGYKKPTLLRRIQRRMGLARVTDVGEYARHLRHSAMEVAALADDLLIHVTGFFRDREAWDALRQKVVVPMVARRDADGELRAWVTACSSGEEAYSLAMVLAEEAERAGKPLGIKVFATDMADRTLDQARAGLYPDGIEAEIEPERLEKFFEKDGEHYRVRPHLRECVVFAPQNVLTDPPFSRLDIVSCRNLLIYLEPEHQQRVLSLLHFGLREGGALFLGTSETVGSLGEMYEPVDKKWRIYRRVGATRAGTVVFPMPTRLSGALEPGGGGGGGELLTGDAALARGAVRPSLATMTQRMLLERFTPAAVVIDREQRVIYYHGKTDRFLSQPAGEPTRDVLQLAREDVRGALRSAVQRSMADTVPVTVQDGLIETVAGRVRVIVSVAPLEVRLAPGYFLVSFEERPEPQSAPDPAVLPLRQKLQPAVWVRRGQ